MLFTIVFDEVGALDTTDIKTAFQACGETQLVSAVLDAETGYVLYGQLPDWMLTPEEASARAKAGKEAREKALAWRKAHNTKEEAKRKECVGSITRVNNGTVTGCWSYPHPIKSDAPLYGYNFKSEYILKVKTINKVEHKYEMRYYELDKRGYEHALKDVTSMYENHNNNWTETQSLFDAQFLHQDDNGEISQLYRFNFFLR